MEAIPTNTAIFSGRGFCPYVHGPGSRMDVTAGTIWGADDVARLRRSPFVRVLPPSDEHDPASQSSSSGQSGGPGLGKGRPYGRALVVDDLVLRTVFWLALAGVPVTSDGLNPSVRSRLDLSLLELLDRVDAAAVADPGERELLSLALRRQARVSLAHRSDHVPRGVVVLLPEGELPPTLAADLAAQSWPAIIRCQAVGEDAIQAVTSAHRAGALYCTRMGVGVRYGPHHLADLIEALRHSGARVAHSPLRFRPWHGAWLENDRVVEGSAIEGMPDGSLWYAEEGPFLPPAPREGYAVHGTGAVPVKSSNGGMPTRPLRLHRSTPAVLAWLGPGVEHGEPVPPSYFATTGSRPSMQG